MKWRERFGRSAGSRKPAEPPLPESAGHSRSSAEKGPPPGPDQAARLAAAGPGEQATLLLSPREAQVFRRLMEGAKMRDIADELSIKTSTVNGYCGEVYKKLGVNSKAQLILRYSEFKRD